MRDRSTRSDRSRHSRVLSRGEMHSLWTKVWTPQQGLRNVSRSCGVTDAGSSRACGRPHLPTRQTTTRLGSGEDTVDHRTDDGRTNARPALGSVWRTLIEDLPPNQRAWLAASSPVTVHENTVIIAVADEF